MDIKTIPESHYEYLGALELDGTRWFAFNRLTKPNFDPEMVLFKRVRYYQLDGTCKLFGPKTKEVSA